jgi:cholesterol transport system auxiliary component
VSARRSAVPRRLVLGGAAALGGCSLLPQPAYVQRFVWPLVVRRPTVSPSRTGGKVLVVREIRPGPGLDQAGVQWLRADGSLHVDFYNQWAVPPAEGITDDLRRWLAGSGLFSAVVGSDSGVTPDLVLEGEVTAFLGDPAQRQARAALAIVLMAARGDPTRVLLQRTVAAAAPLGADTPAGVVAGLLAALRSVLGGTEAALRPFAGR